MRAVRSVGGVPTVVVADTPACQGDCDWPVLTVAAAGICGSDLALLPCGSQVTMGHEIAGTLDGQAYCVEPTVRCASCDQCRSGAPQRCRGCGPHGLLGVVFDGGLADCVRVPRECLVPIPAGLPPSDASLVEPMAVCWHALRRLDATFGERALVVGGGSVGLLAVAAARAMGLHVDLDARHPHQVEAGRRLGAGEPVGEYEVVIESAGTATAFERCVERAAPGGRIAVVGVNYGTLPLAGIPFLTKELTVVASLCYSANREEHEFAAAAGVLANDPDIASTVITHRFPLADAAHAFRVAADRASGAIKVVLEP